VQADVREQRAKVEGYLLHHIHSIPASLHTHGASFRIARTADRAAGASAADLLHVILQPGHELLRKLNPFLSGAACERLRAASLLWGQLCVLEDRLRRLVALVSDGADSAGVDLVQVPGWCAAPCILPSPVSSSAELCCLLTQAMGWCFQFLMRAHHSLHPWLP
jgi:hypothetical protein